MALRRAALVAALAAGACQASAADTEVEQRIERIRELLKTEDGKLAKLEELRGRKLSATLKGSIHGAYDSHHTAYTYEEEMTGALDAFWLIICGTFVMFMQAGFAMVEAGVCRSKNVQSILLKNLTDVAAGTLGWYIFGWSFAYSGPMEDRNGATLKKNRFAGYQEFAGHHFVNDISNNMLEPTNKPISWFFQWAFCATAATIVSGGVAERVNFAGYVIFSFLMTSFIYPIIVAWTWGYGFLADMNDIGYMDFAGSGVVHLTGGIAALVGAIIAGPRKGRFPADWAAKKRMLEFPENFDPHSQPLIVVGTFVLWFGWYGFNCGSTLAMSTAEKGFLAAHVAMNTTLSASVGGLVVFGLRYAMLRRYDIGGLCNGILAGLVSITAGCSTVDTGVTLGIGAIGGILFQGASSLLKIARVDDPIDAFAVHGMCGIWGVLAAALFDWGAGFHHAHGWAGFRCTESKELSRWSTSTGCGPADKRLGNQMFVANLAEIASIIAWSGGLSAIVFGILKLAKCLRASDEDQDDGLDKKHSPSKAYAEDAAAPEDIADPPLASI